MKKPVIGITPSHNTDNDEISVRPTYLRAIEAAGGLSILLPLEVSAEDLKQLSGLCDGFLFSGGPDIHPFLLREETHMHCGNVSVARDTMELSLLKLAMEAKKPVLGICRGAQVINVGLGGDIYQDITSQAETGFPIAHKQPYSCCLPSHHVDVQRDTLLCGIANGKTQIEVNSSHHQAVRRIAPCLIASGHAPDGIIEALEMPDYPYLLALQWHPEYMWKTDTVSANIFKKLCGGLQGIAGRADSRKGRLQKNGCRKTAAERPYMIHAANICLNHTGPSHLSSVLILCPYPLSLSAYCLLSINSPAIWAISWAVMGLSMAVMM